MATGTARAAAYTARTPGRTTRRSALRNCLALFQKIDDNDMARTLTTFRARARSSNRHERVRQVWALRIFSVSMIFFLRQLNNRNDFRTGATFIHRTKNSAFT
ncbi:hypothetical protein [Pseudolabrys sp. FHR47]|uniref:hypothetical protein n=1 Tax=Pseudolabrys sp. FHR47 TaxID=2562284 RepID=UPI00197D6B01|nr:hypothetical protein [Pseudolabrys sp. FHR47]